VPAGYQLSIVDGALDLPGSPRSPEADRDARGDPYQAITRYAAALAMWRGPALADARTLPVVEAGAQRLDMARVEIQERLARRCSRAGARLRLSRCWRT
jgi:hypothetical protein